MYTCSCTLIYIYIHMSVWAGAATYSFFAGQQSEQGGHVRFDQRSRRALTLFLLEYVEG